jgi:hypothetical protein
VLKIWQEIQLIEIRFFSFTTSDAADTKSKTEVSTDPLNNVSAVDRNKVVAVTFSEAMDP